MRAYLDLLNALLEDGVEKSDRTGTGTRIGVAHQMRFDRQEGLPLRTTKAVHALARKKRVEMPITEQIHAILFRNRPPRDALKALMRRGPRAE